MISGQKSADDVGRQHTKGVWTFVKPNIFRPRAPVFVGPVINFTTNVKATFFRIQKHVRHSPTEEITNHACY